MSTSSVLMREENSGATHEAGGIVIMGGLSVTEGLQDGISLQHPVLQTLQVVSQL